MVTERGEGPATSPVAFGTPSGVLAKREGGEGKRTASAVLSLRKKD